MTSIHCLHSWAYRLSQSGPQRPRCPRCHSARSQHRTPPTTSRSCPILSFVTTLLLLVSLCRREAAALQVTTFNILASVHRSMPMPTAPGEDWRESDRIEWWQPRAKQLAEFVATELSSSDVILLQEWWHCPEFENEFDAYTGHIFDRVSERRPGFDREDGMATLINKRGKLELLKSKSVCTGPQRIAQIVQLREKSCSKRIIIGNAHLSFPGGPDATQNERRQAYEAHVVARAVAKEGRTLQDDSHLELIAGDFNSNSCALAASALERSPYCFVNCMSASAQQALGHVGGRVNIGVTHRNHRGQNVSVDHVLARLVVDNKAAVRCSDALMRLGYFDTVGTRLVDCKKRRICLEGDSILSDHRPVTAIFEWPTSSTCTTIRNRVMIDLPQSRGNATLHFLQSPWDS